MSGPRSPAFPCGTAGVITTDPDGQAEFVAEITPLGHHLGGTINNSANLCLSVEGVLNGPVVHHHHALRWRTVAADLRHRRRGVHRGHPERRR